MAPNDQEDDESASEKEENGLNAIETQAAVRCGLCWWLWFCLLRNELLVVLIHDFTNSGITSDMPLLDRLQ